MNTNLKNIRLNLFFFNLLYQNRTNTKQRNFSALQLAEIEIPEQYGLRSLFKDLNISHLTLQGGSKDRVRMDVTP